MTTEVPAGAAGAAPTDVRLATMWGGVFGTIGALALAAYAVVTWVGTLAVVAVVEGVRGEPVPEAGFGEFALHAVMGPLACLLVAAGLARLVALAPGTTVAPWVVGLLGGLVGAVAGYVVLEHLAW